MEQIPQIVEAAGGMSTQTLLWIIAGLMTVITILGNVAKSLIDRRTNPLNGTLGKLNETLMEVNSSLGKLDVRTEASNRVAETSSRVLERHTEKLMSLAVNEAAQTKALLELGPAIDKAMTGVASRITDHCNNRSTAILEALDNG